jgi:dTDP-4-dehydrorhamnose 3,5-epimerase
MSLILEKVLTDACLLQYAPFMDERGVFVKTYNQPLFQEAGISFTLKESYYSISARHVIRGMHFQLPPHQHAKIVFCPVGAILDVIVDLRKTSPTYQQYAARELSAVNQQAFYIPEGFAHGFKALTDGALTYYLVSSSYHKDADTGIRYDSIGMDWDTAQRPVLSPRDLSFPALEAFLSPF